jgi:hypothetical protein
MMKIWNKNTGPENFPMWNNYQENHDNWYRFLNCASVIYGTYTSHMQVIHRHSEITLHVYSISFVVCPFASFFLPLLCLFFDVRLLLTPLVSSNCSHVPITLYYSSFEEYVCSIKGSSTKRYTEYLPRSSFLGWIVAEQM